MKIHQDYSLKKLNSFGIDARARYYVEVTTKEELIHVLNLDDYPDKFILGGGSNMLLRGNIDALVILLNLKGIQFKQENENCIWLEAQAGENWHQFVMYCVNNNYGGLENLALIPGNVGTAPVQNIGAYGVELKDYFFSCKVVDRKTLQEKELSKEACKLGYRDSIFKNEAKDRYVITAVTFKLTKRNHQLHTEYAALQDELKKQHIDQPQLRDIAEAVINIRSSKLPDPKEIGNSGSFFKNPVVSKTVLTTLQQEFPKVPFYELGEDQVKIPAGWLIEQAGFKGKRFGKAGIHDRQALVLVNHGGATGKEIWEVAQNVQTEVKKKFGIALQPEVNIIG